MKTKILLVDDDPNIRQLVNLYLKKEDYDVVLADRGDTALEKFKSDAPNLILLDLMLPKMNGFTVCEILRKESRTPIIMLTALDDDDSQLKGFDALADDYITKPFSMPVVMKHIEAVLRRTEPAASESLVIRYKALVLDADSFSVQVNGSPVSLTTREFEILKFLLENQGRVFTRDNLLDRIWD